MNKMVISIGIVILIAVAAVLFLNKSSDKSVLDANILADGTPTTIPLSPTVVPSAIPTSSTSAFTSPLPSSAPSTAVPSQQSPSSAPEVNLKATTAVIKTSKGDIELQLYPDAAPNTVANFVKKAATNFYNNLIFHRVEDWVIQGGDPLGNGTGGGQMQTELNNKPFVVGALGVARGQDIRISNDSQFFITKKDSQFLNGQYTNFGIVTKGMDVVNNIAIGDKILSITTQ